MRILLVILALLTANAGPAAAQLDPAACGAQDFPLPAPFETWGHPREPRPWLRLNETQSLKLYRGVRFASGAATRERPRRYAGAVGFTAERDGEYRVAMSGSAAVDMLRDGETVPSTGRRSGPPCSDVERILTYTLRRGDHVIQVSSDSPDVAILVYR